SPAPEGSCLTACTLPALADVQHSDTRVLGRYRRWWRGLPRTLRALPGTRAQRRTARDGPGPARPADGRAGVRGPLDAYGLPSPRAPGRPARGDRGGRPARPGQCGLLAAHPARRGGPAGGRGQGGVAAGGRFPALPDGPGAIRGTPDAAG